MGDNISRDMLETGTLARYIADLSVTGLTSNPTIFEHAIGKGGRYDDDIARLMREGLTSKATFFALALFLTGLRKQLIERDPASVWLCGEFPALPSGSAKPRPVAPVATSGGAR